MAREFGTYSPVVELGTAWEETLVLLDSAGVAQDLTGYDVVCQLHAAKPARDADDGGPATAPILEITTADYYVTPPAYTVEGFTVATPTNGTITLRVDEEDLWAVSPTNRKIKLFWSIVLVSASRYVIPVVTGKVTFKQNNTVLSE